MKPKRNVTTLRKLKSFPVSPRGYDDVVYSFDRANFSLTYSCLDSDDLAQHGTLLFEFVIGLCIENENNDEGVEFPDTSATLYGFETKARRGFRGYQIYFSNNDVVTVICERVLVGNEEF